jgi:hypothetical protein
MRVVRNPRFVAAWIRMTHLAGFRGTCAVCSIISALGRRAFSQAIGTSWTGRCRHHQEHPELKWDALRDNDGMYVGRFRKGISGVPKKQPTKYLPLEDLFKRPPK